LWETYGMFTIASESTSAFIGLDEGMISHKFKELVIQATQDAKK
jgi:hypothetical protein